MILVGKKIFWSKQDLGVLDDMMLTLFKLNLSNDLKQSFCMNCGSLMMSKSAFCSVKCKMEYFD